MSGYSESATVSQLLKKVEEPAVEMRDVIGSADTSPALDKHDEIIEIGEDFDFDGFQVVRREFFAHLGEPSVTFNSCKFYVNAACLTKFPTSDYAQVLINRQKKILLVCFSVCVKRLSAPAAHKVIDGLAVYQFGMRIPPFHPAPVRTEFLFPFVRSIYDGNTALLTAFLCGNVGRPFTVILYGVWRKPEGSCNSSVSEPLLLQGNDFIFLLHGGTSLSVAFTPYWTFLRRISTGNKK